MDSYIVRVVRREQVQQDHTIHLDGVVETGDSGKRQVFHNADQLWSILLGLEEIEGSMKPDE